MAKKRIPHFVDPLEIEENAGGLPQYTFATILNRLMEEGGIDQEKMASDLGMSTGAIHNYRHGKTEPKLSAIIKIAEYLGVDCDYLMRGVSSKNISVTKATGLNDASIQNLRKLSGWDENSPPRFQRETNDLISSNGLQLLLDQIQSFKQYVSLYKNHCRNFSFEMSKIGITIPVTDPNFLKTVTKYAEMDSLQAIFDGKHDANNAAKTVLNYSDKKSYYQYKIECAIRLISEEIETKIR